MRKTSIKLSGLNHMEARKLPTAIAQDLPTDALLAYYQLADEGFLQTIFFEGSRFFTQIMTSFHWGNLNRWDRVAKNLYLGILPSFGQYKQLIDEVRKNGGELSAVVSVVTMPHLVGFGVDPLSVWIEENIEQRVLLIPDFTANADNRDIINSVLFMEQIVKGINATNKEENKKDEKNEKAIFVHCKAGKSRSAMICLIYLYFFGKEEGLNLSGDINDINADVKTIEEYLISKRIQVEILPCQREKAIEVINIMRQLQKEGKLSIVAESNENQKTTFPIEEKPKDIKSALKETLHSLHLKNEIIHLPSFLAMGYYALCNQYSWFRKAVNSFGYFLNIIKEEAQDSPQKKSIKDFFISIYSAKDETWYLDLINSQGPLQKFKEIDTYSFGMWNNEGDKKERGKLCDGFIQDLNSYLADSLNCNVEEILQAAKELKAERSFSPQKHN